MVNDLLSTPNIPTNLPPKVREAREMFNYAALFFVIAAGIWVLWGLWSILSGILWSSVYYYSGGYAVYQIVWGIIRIGLGVVAFILKGKFVDSIIRPIDQGNYKKADDQMILYVVLGFIFGLGIGGILILIGHMKLNEAETQAHNCPTCSAQLRYIPQNNGWYCDQCADYKVPVQPAQPSQPPQQPQQQGQQYGGQPSQQQGAQGPPPQGQPQQQQQTQQTPAQQQQPPQQQTPQQQPQQQQQQQGENTCSTCGSQLRWIAQYNRWYCDSCQEYK